MTSAPTIGRDRLAELIRQNDEDLAAARAMQHVGWVVTLTKRRDSLLALAERMRCFVVVGPEPEAARVA